MTLAAWLILLGIGNAAAAIFSGSAWPLVIALPCVVVPFTKWGRS